MFKFYTHPHLTSPIKGEETFPRLHEDKFPRPWWEGLGEGGTDTLFQYLNHRGHDTTMKKLRFQFFP